MPVDPFFLTRKKDYGRKSLAQNSRSQIACEKNIQAYSRETKKALNLLQNSKSHHTKMLKTLQDRQMEICRNREQEQILIQAQSRYDRVPVLETKRFCGACARRPKSAKASMQVTVDGLLRPGKQTSSKCHLMTFSTYEHRTQPPKPLLKRKVKSAVVTPSVKPVCCHDDLQQYSQAAEDILSAYSERVLTTPTSQDSVQRPRSISPMRTFDHSVIPDFRKHSRVGCRPSRELVDYPRSLRSLRT